MSACVCIGGTRWLHLRCLNRLLSGGTSPHGSNQQAATPCVMFRNQNRNFICKVRVCTCVWAGLSLQPFHFVECKICVLNECVRRLENDRKRLRDVRACVYYIRHCLDSFGIGLPFVGVPLGVQHALRAAREHQSGRHARDGAHSATVAAAPVHLLQGFVCDCAEDAFGCCYCIESVVLCLNTCEYARTCVASFVSLSSSSSSAFFIALVTRS